MKVSSTSKRYRSLCQFVRSRWLKYKGHGRIPERQRYMVGSYYDFRTGTGWAQAEIRRYEDVYNVRRFDWTRLTPRDIQYWLARKKADCLCCSRRVRAGERFIVVGSTGIQHRDTCPRSRR